MRLSCTLHPAVHVTAGFFFVFLSQFCEGRVLVLLASGLLLVALKTALGHWLRVMRRLRFVALTILVLFAWQTPGTFLLPALESLSPTRDGLILAIVPLLRLLSVASVVAILKECLSPDAWVSSLYAISRPLGIFGVSREKLAIRLRLVLDHAEEQRLNWRTLLQEAPGSGVETSALSCEVSCLSSLDRVCISLILLLAVAVGVW